MSPNPPPRRNMCFYKQLFSLSCFVAASKEKKHFLFGVIVYVRIRKAFHVNFMYHCHPFFCPNPPLYMWNLLSVYKPKTPENWNTFFMLLLFILFFHLWPKVKLNKNLFCCSFAFIFLIFFFRRAKIWEGWTCMKWVLSSISFQNIQINAHLLFLNSCATETSHEGIRTSTCFTRTPFLNYF